MPVMNGIQAVKEIRRREGIGILKHKNFIVAMTACASSNQKKISI